MKPKWVRSRMAADRRTERELLAVANRIDGYLMARKDCRCEVTDADVRAGRDYERAMIAEAEREAARRRA